MTIIDERWKSLLKEFERKSERKLIYVLGPTDSGKTTFYLNLDGKQITSGNVTQSPKNNSVYDLRTNHTLYS